MELQDQLRARPLAENHQAAANQSVGVDSYQYVYCLSEQAFLLHCLGSRLPSRAVAELPDAWNSAHPRWQAESQRARAARAGRQAGPFRRVANQAIQLSVLHHLG